MKFALLALLLVSNFAHAELRCGIDSNYPHDLKKFSPVTDKDMEVTGVARKITLSPASDTLSSENPVTAKIRVLSNDGVRVKIHAILSIKTLLKDLEENRTKRIEGRAIGTGPLWLSDLTVVGTALDQQAHIFILDEETEPSLRTGNKVILLSNNGSKTVKVGNFDISASSNGNTSEIEVKLSIEGDFSFPLKDSGGGKLSLDLQHSNDSGGVESRLMGDLVCVDVYSAL